MWHGAYVAWLEEARVEALVAAGLTYAEMTTLGVEMPVVSLNIHYRHALCHGDMVVLESISSLPVGVRWPWRCQMLCNGQLMADASVELVMVTAGRVLRRPPAHLQALMDRLRQGPAAEDV
jgi:acyl-CoA thioester hydrolase